MCACNSRRHRVNNNHFSPAFANEQWTADKHYVCYYRDHHKGRVSQTTNGRRQWGRLRRLYTDRVEYALNHELETPASLIYDALLRGRSLDAQSRLKWSQFLRSQFVRTPTFMRYEETAKQLTGVREQPLHDRVGCEECLDLHEVAGRDWTILVAHPDDFFIRTDNPVYVTGFLISPKSVLYYPLSPRCCFAACSMPDDWNPDEDITTSNPSHTAVELEKGVAHVLNFYFARAAGESAIVCPDHDSAFIRAMLTQVLGIYPQMPFDLHMPKLHEVEDARESLRGLMTVADGVEYATYRPPEIEPFYAK